MKIIILPLFRASKRNCKFSANEPYKTDRLDKVTELNSTTANNVVIQCRKERTAKITNFSKKVK